VHRPTWGSVKVNNRGNVIDSLLQYDQNLILLNNPNLPTYFCPCDLNGTFCSIDLILSSYSLATSITWNTHFDLCDSDHFPILLSGSLTQQIPFTPPPKWLFNKADRQKFIQFTAATNNIFPCDSIEHYPTTFNEFILDAANKCIPKSSPKPNKQIVPWWSPRIQSAIFARNPYTYSENLNHKMTQ